MLKRRGQLTLFIIIGVILVIAIFSFFLIKNNINDNQNSNLDPKTKVIKNELIDCFDIIYQDSLNFVGAQGGYYNEPTTEHEMVSNIMFIPYYKYNNNINMLPLGFITSEIETTVDSTIDYCFKTTSMNHPETGILFSKYNTIVEINEESVNFLTKINIAIGNESKIIIIEMEEKRKISSNLKEMYDIADYYLYSSIIYGNNIPADGLFNMAKEKDLFIDINNFNEGALIVNIYTQSDKSYPVSFNFLDKPSEYENDFVFTDFNETYYEEELNELDLEE